MRSRSMVRQAQHHVFLARAAGADGAGVFAAVAGVQGNDDQAVGAAGQAGCHGRPALALRYAPLVDAQAGRARGAAAAPALGGVRARCGAIRSPKGSAPGPVGRKGQGLAVRCTALVRVGRVMGVAQAFGDQRFQRVGHLGGVQVKHQPVLVGGHRWQCEHLRRNRLLEVEHQAHHAGCKLPTRMPAMLGSSAAPWPPVPSAPGSVRCLRCPPPGAADWRQTGLVVSTVRFDGHPRIVRRGPHPHRHDGGATGECCVPSSSTRRARTAAGCAGTGFMRPQHRACSRVPRAGVRA
jgi:hypothetical protein